MADNIRTANAASIEKRDTISRELEAIKNGSANSEKQQRLQEIKENNVQM
jgi:hypothetical protein